MHFADLQLITFDGFPLDARSRALRFVSTWLSFCSGGVGLLWAVADEENLTWHDHISKTFPTIREVPGTFVRQRRSKSRSLKHFPSAADDPLSAIRGGPGRLNLFLRKNTEVCQAGKGPGGDSGKFHSPLATLYPPIGRETRRIRY